MGSAQTDPPTKKKPFQFGGLTPEEQLKATQLKASGGVAGTNEAKQEALKDYDTNFKKYLEGPGVGKAIYRGYNDMKEFQNKLPFLPRTLSEVITSPIDLGVKTSVATDKRRNALMTDEQDHQQYYDLLGTAVDFIALGTLGKTSLLKQATKTAFNLSKRPAAKTLAKVLPWFSAKELFGQKVEDEIGYSTGLKEKKSK